MHFGLTPGLSDVLAGGAPAAASGGSPLLNFSDLFSVASQATATATNAITATAAVTTSTTPVNTPVPLPTQAPAGAGGMKWNFVDWEWLTGVPNPPLGPLAYGFIVVMLGLLAAGVYFYFVKRGQWKRENHTVHRRAAERWAPMAIWIGLIGILFALFRVVNLDFFNLRIWLYMWLLVAIGVGVWFYVWYRNSYPSELAKFQKRQRAQQYMPTARKKGSASRPTAQTASTGAGAAVQATTTPTATAAPTTSTSTSTPSANTNASSKRRKRR